MSLPCSRQWSNGRITGPGRRESHCLRIRVFSPTLLLTWDMQLTDWVLELKRFLLVWVPLTTGIDRQASCWSCAVTAEVMTSLRVILAVPCLLTLCQASSQWPMPFGLGSLTQPVFDHLCLVSILTLGEPWSSCSAPPLFPPGSHWGITSLHPVHKSPPLDHIASSCPNAGWLHHVPGTPPPT